MNKLIAVLVLSSAFSANAYTLSPQECYQGADISARATMERDKGTPKESLISQTQARKSQYTEETLYNIVLDIVEIVYSLPELDANQHAQRFLDECVRTKGQMNSKV